jgi:hypothetical protein
MDFRRSHCGDYIVVCQTLLFLHNDRKSALGNKSIIFSLRFLDDQLLTCNDMSGVKISAADGAYL